MAKNSDTTKTDKKTFSVKIIDQSKFNALSDDDKVIFEILRNSMLEIIPSDSKGKYIDEAVQYAENFAFIGLSVFEKFYETKIQKQLELLKSELSESIASLATLATPASGGTGGGATE